MINNEIIKCKTKIDVINLSSFFETIISKNNNPTDIELTRKIMLENINNDNYFMYFIKQDDKIIAGIRAFIISETLRIDVLAVDKNYRKMGLSKSLIKYILDNSKIKINDIFVVPDKYDTDDSFSYCMHNGFEAFLCLSCFEDIDFEKYNKYKLKIASYKVEPINDGKNKKNYNSVKYYIDIPNKDYTLYYENTIDNCFCYYLFVKKVNKRWKNE